jgi:hypothetical protein
MVDKKKQANWVLSSRAEFHGNVHWWQKLLCCIGAHDLDTETDYNEGFPAATRGFDQCQRCNTRIWRH